MGRGVTDCLGHVALLTEFMRTLGVKRPPLRPTVVAVFIANEENATVGGWRAGPRLSRGFRHARAVPVAWQVLFSCNWAVSAPPCTCLGLVLKPNTPLCQPSPPSK
jgi:hypothetical protein